MLLEGQVSIEVEAQVSPTTPLPLTTIMVNLKNLNKSLKNPTLPPGIQDSSNSMGESPDSLNLLSRASSRAGKRVHSRGRPQTHCIARRSSRSVSASSAKGTLLLRPYLHLPQEKVRRKVWVLTPRCLLLQE